MTGRLYFSYGSNISPRQMQQRCPGAERVGALVLPKGRLVFRQVADIIYDPNSTIAGAVWRITERHERTLDHYEGVASGVYKKKYIKLSIKGGPSEDCLYYKMTDKSGVAPPTLDYYHTILEGYEAFKLDKELLLEAVHRSYDKKNITPDIARRRRKSTSPIKRRSKTLASHVPPVLVTSQVKSTTGKRRKK